MSDTNTPAGRAGLAYDWLAPKLSTTERQELDVIVRDLTAAQEQIAALTAERDRLREVEAALWELVKLKDAKERVEELSARMMTGAEMAEINRLNKYYKTGKEPAWEAARAALAPERTAAGQEETK